MSDADAWRSLAAFTPARIAQGRAGNGLPTRRVLEFQLAHARARDAVHAPFDTQAVADALAPRPARLLTTQAQSRADYLAFPDHGRRLSEASRAALTPGPYDAALVIADGLSATAIALHAAALATLIFEVTPNFAWAPVSVVTNGRVAVGDDVAAALGAELAVVLIGERPGLSAADSLGLYLTRRPRPGTTSDAERNCISNVRPGGLGLAEAAQRLAWLMNRARHLGLTGVGLKEDTPEALPDGRPAAC
jgi:ethanolamine ammonia-lyase small subunit